MAIYRNDGPRPVWSSQNQFRFPTTHHLVITTAAKIFLLNKSGIRTLLHSPSGGILAVREAKDGSGNIAFADGQIVIVHSIQKVSGKTFKLHAEKGQIRLLEFSSDYQRLFFTTSLHHSILCFSLSDERVISTTFPHPSPPTVLIRSKDSSILVTASEIPVVIYVHDLRCLTAPPMLHPQASSSPVTSGAFHPDRNDVFLLCFLDGTIASYYILKKQRDNCPEDKQSHLIGLSGCERVCFKRLHKTVNVKIRSDSIKCPTKDVGASEDKFSEDGIGIAAYAIAGAAFVPGYRSRAVSVGADGKCRLIDFENEGKLLRTWHIGASATCLSILSLDEMKPTLKPPISHNNNYKVQNKDYIIAVGRADGIVMLFDSVGLLLQEWAISETRAKVTSVDWSLNCTTVGMFDANAYVPKDTIINVPLPKDVVQNNPPRESFAIEDPLNMDAPPRGRSSVNALGDSKESAYDTILTKPKDICGQDRAKLVPSGKLVDLFSSAKKKVRQKQSYHIRPRISSSTFLTNSQTPGNGLSKQSKNYTATKGFHCHCLSKFQRSALDGQNSDSKANGRTYEMLPRELLQSQYQKQHGYPIPGSFFSSESSSSNKSDESMDENFESGYGWQSRISGLKSSIRSEGSLSSGNLDDSLDDQQNKCTEVIKDSIPTTNPSANNERVSKGPETPFVAKHPLDDWGNGTKILPPVPSAPLPRLTAENLLLKQAAILSLSPGQSPHRAGCSSVPETFSKFDMVTRSTEIKQLPKAEKHYDYKSRASHERNVEDNAFNMQCIDYPTYHSCCTHVKKELHQLQCRIETLNEKVVDVHRLIQCHI